MVKPKPSSSSGGEETRRQIVEAALAVLRKEGFEAATSRAIAREGSVNSALIFYHFGSVDSLLLAALDHSSAARLERYESRLGEATTLDELLAAAVELYAEDRASGHMAVLSQMIAGAVARPELAPEITRRIEPWLDLCERTLTRAAESAGLDVALPIAELAYGIAAFAAGNTILTHLDPERSRADALLAHLQALAASMR